MIGPAITWSSLTLARTSSRERIASSAASVASANISTSVRKQQRRPPLRRNDAVVDLQHVEHRRDEQQVQQAR